MVCLWLVFLIQSYSCQTMYCGALGSYSGLRALQDILHIWGKHSDLCLIQHKLLLLSCLGLTVAKTGLLDFGGAGWGRVSWKITETLSTLKFGYLWHKEHRHCKCRELGSNQWLILYILGSCLIVCYFFCKTGIVIMRIRNNKCKTQCLVQGSWVGNSYYHAKALNVSGVCILNYIRLTVYGESANFNRSLESSVIFKLFSTLWRSFWPDLFYRFPLCIT